MAWQLRTLRLLFRWVGCICLLALLAMVMPREWMATCHRWLGLGTFPDQPIAEYLARTTSGLSAFYGGLLLILSHDIVRYASIVRYQAWAMGTVGAVGLVMGLRAGMPLFWMIGDAGGLVAFCGITLWLLARTGTGDS